ncbi:hypothetical protein [Pedobacter frigoris]|uniref:Uncharacterized protein n=1 Tax=Pedobacter frigoris TaxID=2571272 RepID=A0A4V5NYG2_9SPHI|nr:hypothetical protein [Pedobacter frigoris]TKC03654.1 hypothetical protein FA047_19000 [Pedobacter frigoris]
MDDVVKGLVPHILSFVINELCRNGFLIAYERDLADLKGLVSADSITPDDFELLESVDDGIVKVLLKSVDKVIDCSKTYLMINNLDELEVLENEECNQEASNSYHIYILEWESKNYKDLLFNLNPVYFSISQLLYHTSCQLRLNTVDIPEEMYDEFLEHYAEVLHERLISEDKNVSLLYDLIIELNMDLCEIDRLTWERED